MAIPRASVQNHRDLWAGVERPEEGVALVAEMAANVRADAAPEPSTADAEYEARAKSAELYVGSFIGQRGVIKTAGAGGASVTFAEQAEALDMAARMMGVYAAGDAGGTGAPVVTFTEVPYP